jgi:GTP pyrophosphokinase
MAESKLTEQECKEMRDEYVVQLAFERLMDKYIRSNHRRKVELITKAFNFAKLAHAGVFRIDGDPYILHPLAVALIACDEMGLGSTSICSALLHDVVEDTEFEVENISDMFGEKIAQIVDGLTKLPSDLFVNHPDYKAAENFRKLLLTMSSDVRVVLVKLADRLHNMRTLSSMRPDKQYKIAGETMFIYAPLAHRLGLFTIKSELEDLCFKYEHPEDFRIITQKLAATEDRRQQLFDNFAKPIRQRLSQLMMTYQMKARVKSAYSIWNKMQTKKVSFEDIYDVFAIRIVFEPTGKVNEKNLCWDIYSAITDIYRTRPDRLREWITKPKANGYQALHLTVMGPDGQWIEIQIRSKRMDDIDELGYAAHWKYKSGNTDEDTELDKWLHTITEILDNPNPDTLDFLDTIKMNLFSAEIYVFTPKGELKTLPQGATALDFAYMLHSNLGNTCIGAKINHRLVPLSHKLESGDQVEIVTAAVQSPKPEWLNFIVTARARTKIEAELRRERKEKIRLGMKKVLDYFENRQQESSQSNINRLMWHFSFTKPEDLYYAVETGEVRTPEDLDKALDKKSKVSLFGYVKRVFSGDRKKPTDKDGFELREKKKYDKSKPYELTEDALGKCNYQIASCCKPIPGDDVFGFINDDGSVIVHKQSCHIGTPLKARFGDRILSTEWKNHVSRSFEATLQVEGFDKVGVLTDIARTISEYNVNIIRLHVEVKDGVFKSEIKLLVHDVEDIQKMCLSISKLESIDSVIRVDD